MPRRSPDFLSSTRLGAEIIAKRGTQHLKDVAAELGVRQNTVSRLERGECSPSAATALKLAKWLGWTMEEVMEASVRERTPEGGNHGRADDLQ
jgi:transcriptional regulator with XRE-family HTH domain